MSHRGYREASRLNYGADEEKALTIDQISLGCMLRIADATEKIAQEYDELLRQRNHYKNQSERFLRELRTMTRSNNALRGHIKRMKNKREVIK